MSVAALQPAASPASADASASTSAERRQIATAAREFEAMFLLQMLKQMRQSMLAEETEEPGLGAATMAETFDVELSRHLAGQRGGLSSILEKALDRTSGGVRPGSDPILAATPVTGVNAGVVANRASDGVRPRSDPNQPLTVLPGRISSDFGWRRDPVTGATKFHRGTDIAAAYGAEVPAAAAGTVTFSGTQGSYGKLVILTHEGGTETRYAHLSQIDVREGDVVKAGEVVGRVGQSGRATGPHLHFEVREDGQPVDLLKDGAVMSITRVGGPAGGAGLKGAHDED